MAFLPEFACDIFISYAHIDNEDGWVTRFHERLQIALNGVMEGVTIWRDKGLRSNTEFDPEIEKQVNGSGIFLALVSNRYLRSSYCGQELRMFHGKAQEDRYGLSIENQKRIFNLLLYNIAHDQWPDEIKGITGLKFHDEFGMPTLQSVNEFDFQLRKLTGELVGMLQRFKQMFLDRPAPPPHVPVPPPALTTQPLPPDAFTVFLAHTSSALEVQTERIANELTHHGIRVITDVPPPYEPEKHDERVKEVLQKAGLAIHLLTGIPGERIHGLLDRNGQPLNKSYSRRQVELSLAHAPSQLIWLPPELEIKEIENIQYQQFLAALERGERPASSRIVRTPKSELPHVALETVKQLRKTPSPPTVAPAALLNFHQKDGREVWRLCEYLSKKGVLPFTEPELDDPKLTIKNLENRIKQVNRLIIVFGDVGREWVQQRLYMLVGIANTNNCLPTACGIYFTSSRRKEVDGNFSLPPTIPKYEFDIHDIDGNKIEPLL